MGHMKHLSGSVYNMCTNQRYIRNPTNHSNLTSRFSVRHGFLHEKVTKTDHASQEQIPSPIQITAEQLLREARELQDATQTGPPKYYQIIDAAEFADHQFRKRKEFEDQIRRTRGKNFSRLWAKYAEWEESNGNNARSVWERAITEGDNYRNPTLWVKYAEAEMKNKYPDHARNLWERAVGYLPRVDQLWIKYIDMEDPLGNVARARRSFERWMEWMPDQLAWSSYVKFELKYNEVELARAVYEGFVKCHADVAGAWIGYAEFETRNVEVANARNVFERALATQRALSDNKGAEQLLLVAFAEFLEGRKEIEHTRSLYKSALEGRPMAEELYDEFLSFEKRHGNSESIENVIEGKRRSEYGKELKKNPLDYDSWFEYIKLELSAGNRDRIREVYERGYR